MPKRDNSSIGRVFDRLIEKGTERSGSAFTELFSMAMHLEREQYLSVGHYEHSAPPKGYKRKRIDTAAGILEVSVPKSLERGCRSARADWRWRWRKHTCKGSQHAMSRISCPVRRRDLSAMQVSRATARLDADLSAWRNFPLDKFPHLIVDIRYEKVCIDGDRRLRRRPSHRRSCPRRATGHPRHIRSPAPKPSSIGAVFSRALSPTGYAAAPASPSTIIPGCAAPPPSSGLWTGVRWQRCRFISPTTSFAIPPRRR